MRTGRIAVVLVCAVLAVSACAPVVSPSATSTPTLTATPSPTPTASPTATTTAVVPITGGTAAPQVSVTSPTNCRTGPSVAYSLVFTAMPGTSYTVVGAFSGGNYWIINDPFGTTCWLWGNFAVVSGNTAALPTFPAPFLPVPAPTQTPKPKATAIPTAPGAPSNLSQAHACSSGMSANGTPIWIETVTITWDPGTGQTGYNIFRNNSEAATLAANATSFFTTIRYDKTLGAPLFDNFGIEAFNDEAAAQRVSIDVPRCP